MSRFSSPRPRWSANPKAKKYANKILDADPSHLFFYYRLNDSTTVATDSGPNNYHGTHNANVQLSQPGPDGQSPAAYYAYNGATSVPAFTNIGTGAASAVLANFPMATGTYLIWQRGPAQIDQQGQIVSIGAAGSTITASALIGRNYNVPTYFDDGTASSGFGGSQLQDLSKNWTVNAYAAQQVFIISGTNKGQTKTITSNTSTNLVLSSAYNTNISPGPTSRYFILGTEFLEWIVMISAGTGAADNNPYRSIIAFNNATGQVTMDQAFSTTPDTGSSYTIYSGLSNIHAKQTTGGKTLFISTNNGQNGVIQQVEVLTSRQTVNRIGQNVEQQLFTNLMFQNAIDPGWICYALTWDETAGSNGQVFGYQNGALINSTLTPSNTQPFTGLSTWAASPQAALIGSQNQTGTFISSKHGHFWISDVAVWSSVLPADKIKELASRT